MAEERRSFTLPRKLSLKNNDGGSRQVFAKVLNGISNRSKSSVSIVDGKKAASRRFVLLRMAVTIQPLRALTNTNVSLQVNLEEQALRSHCNRAGLGHIPPVPTRLCN